ncbi:Uncharacterized protein DAT39_008944, partial [Clarias magur]
MFQALLIITHHALGTHCESQSCVLMYKLKTPPGDNSDRLDDMTLIGGQAGTPMTA